MGTTGDLAWRVRGVAVVVAGLSAVYLVEWVLAAVLGFAAVNGLVLSLPVGQRRLLVAVAGPLVHSGLGHLVENLVFLSLFGGYVEWYLGWRRLVLYAAVTGYGAGWLLLGLGGPGAVGASGAANGLASIAGFVAAVEVVGLLSEERSRLTLNLLVVHAVVLVVGLGLAWETIRTGFAGPTAGRALVHALGAVLGLGVGVPHFIQRVAREL